MKKIRDFSGIFRETVMLLGLIIVFMFLLTGCGTWREAMTPIGAAAGAIVGGEKGAWIGGAAGYGLGAILDNQEEKQARKEWSETQSERAKAREPKVVDLGNGKKAVIVYGRPTGNQNRVSSGYGYGADCGIFQTPNEQAECERGKRYAEDKLRRERERRAYEYGQYGGGH